MKKSERSYKLRERTFSNPLSANARNFKKAIDARIQKQRWFGGITGFVAYLAGGLLVVIVGAADNVPIYERVVFIGVGVALLLVSVTLLRLAFVPIKDTEYLLANAFESLYIYLPMLGDSATKMSYRRRLNSDLARIAELVWTLPSYLNTSDKVIIVEVNRIAGAVLAKQVSVSLQGVEDVSKLETWCLQSYEHLAAGNWHLICAELTYTMEPPKLTESQRKRLLIIASLNAGAGVALVGGGVLTGTSIVVTVSLIPASILFFMARYYFGRAGIDTVSMADSQALAKGFAAPSRDGS